MAARSPATTPFAAGDVIAFRHSGGTRFVLWVDHNQTDAGGTYSDVEVLEPDGPPVDLGDLEGYPGTQFRYQPGEATPHLLGFVLLGTSRIATRCEVLGNVRRPASRPRYEPVVVPAGQLDGWLQPFVPGGDRILRHPKG